MMILFNVYQTSESGPETYPKIEASYVAYPWNIESFHSLKFGVEVMLASEELSATSFFFSGNTCNHKSFVS